jgi:transposase
MGGSQSRPGPAHLEARRLSAIEMVAEGVTQAEVARRLSVSREAVRQWVHAFRGGGKTALASRPRRKRGRVPLTEVAQVLEQERVAVAALTTPHVRGLIERAHGVAYSMSSVRAILRRLGYAYTREVGWRSVAPTPEPRDASVARELTG